MSDIKYPEIKVKLSGTDGNAYAIMGKVKRALQKADVHLDTIDLFTEEAMSGDYDNLLQTCMQWVTVS